MTLRIAVLAYIAFSFLCAAHFIFGEGYFDPSFEYTSSELFWLNLSQWLALLGPVIGGWLLQALLLPP